MAKLLQISFIFCLILLTGCTSQPIQPSTFQDKDSRTQQLEKISHWKIKGKIAFLDEKNKQSANLYWQQSKNSLRLTLTTFLGINVLTLEQSNGLYILESDGNEWQNENLQSLLHQATGLKLPVQAMSAWLKGLKASDNDIIKYDPITQLPTELTAQLEDEHWHINFQTYAQFQDFKLANKMTLKHKQLTIKLVIHSWELN